MRRTRTATNIAAPCRVDPQSGLLLLARQVESPNSDARPDGVAVDLIVIHGISLPPGEYGGPWIDELFTNRLSRTAHPYFEQVATLHVSSHLLVRRDGEVVQYVPLQRRAWHAGESCWCGRRACNDFSVGIELEGADDVPYAAPQYVALVALIAALRRAYPSLRNAAVVGHSDIAPGRKTDPGPAFDWPKLNQLLARRGTVT